MAGILRAVLGLVIRVGVAAGRDGSGLADDADFARFCAAGDAAAAVTAALEADLPEEVEAALPLAGFLVIADFFGGSDFIGSKRRGCRAQEDTHGKES